MNYIRDGLYGYIAITPIEDVIINNPSIYRLHRILQNSTFFHTFPYNRGSRFIHSLGTMHIAGKMCFRLFQNSEDDLAAEVVNAVKTVLFEKEIPTEILRNAHSYLVKSQMSSKKRGVEVSEGSYFRSYGWPVSPKLYRGRTSNYLKIDSNFIKNLIFQAVRIAALVHDIGHPPYSHVVEFALDDLELYAKELAKRGIEVKLGGDDRKKRVSFPNTLGRLNSDYNSAIKQKLSLLFHDDTFEIKGKLHEKVGLTLLHRIVNLDQAYISNEKDFYAFFTLSLSLAELIISLDQLGHFTTDTFVLANRKNPMVGKLFALANIISGSVDCDRLDYILRDAETSGVPDFRSFDQDRIIQNLTLAKKYRDDTKEYIIVPAFHRRAFSALVDFFNSKLKAYRWLIGHHSVVRSDIALNRTALTLSRVHQNFLENEFFPIERQAITFLNRFFTEHVFDSFLNLTYENYRYLDDAWLDTYLQQLLKKMLNLKHQKRLGGSQTLPRMLMYLQVLYERKTDSMRAIWKREDEFMNFAKSFLAAFRKGWNPKNPKKAFSEAKTIEDIQVLLGSEHRRIPTATGIQSENHEFDDQEPTDKKVDPVEATNRILQIWAENEPVLKSPYTCFIPVERRLKAGDIVFALKSYKPYQQVLLVGKEDSDLIPLEDMSSFIRDIDKYSHSQLLLYAYDVAPSRDWQTSRISDLGEEVATIILSDMMA